MGLQTNCDMEPLAGQDLAGRLWEKLECASGLSGEGARQLMEAPGTCPGTWICRVICLRLG